MKYNQTLLLTLIFLAASASSTFAVSANPNLLSTPQNRDSAAVIQPIKGFLRWYRANYNKANDFSWTITDQTGNYAVDHVACEQYLKYLQSSGYISNTYIKEWRKFFKSKAQYFKEFPQSEGPPYGFDLDLVLITQEPELILDHLDKLKFKIKSRTAKTAIVEVVGEFSYEFELSLVQGKWKIDYIATMNYD